MRRKEDRREEKRRNKQRREETRKGRVGRREEDRGREGTEERGPYVCAYLPSQEHCSEPASSPDVLGLCPVGGAVGCCAALVRECNELIASSL